MNRLVIVGNGFDLAHGLPTGYCDFINNYWQEVFNLLSGINVHESTIYEDDFIKFEVRMASMYLIDCIEQFRKISTYSEFREYFKEISKPQNRNHGFIHSLKFKNKFFTLINNEHLINNWVDIENEYYKVLKDCLAENDSDRKYGTNVLTLNKEFEQVKQLLEKYLDKYVCRRYRFDMPNEAIDKITDIFNIKYRYIDKKKFFEEFPNEDHRELRGFSNKIKDFVDGINKNLTNLVESNDAKIINLFLNFNYTPTVDAYKAQFKNDDMDYFGENRVIHIHGKVNHITNKINFGFGDEMDSHYKLIEENGDNQYLQNIKSFQYLQNSNYRQLLDFIETKKFQVYLMGHSCGLSDRILLNTIFEHSNCRSIKVFFYEKNGTDNYTEIVQNISRHFNKKKMMRDKIVNKMLCQPLPQDVRFEITKTAY